MGLRKRLIARLDIKPPNLIKPVHLEGFKVIGRPADYAKKYAEGGIDEILYMDVVASLYGRNGLESLIEETAEAIFVPITVGGGIRSLADCERMFRSGADKVCINTAAIKRPRLVRDISDRYGAQALCVSIEAKRVNGGWEAYTDNGREKTGKDAIAWAQEAAELGAGELLITSIDREGTERGFDDELLKTIRKLNLAIPIVISGGAGNSQHVLSALLDEADAVAIASILHYNRTTIGEIHKTAREVGIPLGH